MIKILSLIFLLFLFVIPNDAQNKSLVLTNNDKAQMIKAILLKESLLNRVLYLNEKKEIIYLSNLNIVSVKLPKIQGLKIVSISDDQLKEKAETGFHYFEFGQFQVTTSKIKINFGHCYENTRYDSSYSRGTTYSFKKVRGKWMIEIIGVFASDT